MPKMLAETHSQAFPPLNSYGQRRTQSERMSQQFSDIPIPSHLQGSETLSEATRNLISLGSAYNSNTYNNNTLQHDSASRARIEQYDNNRHRSTESFPFLKKPPLQYQQSYQHPYPRTLPQISIAPARTVGGPSNSQSSSTSQQTPILSATDYSSTDYSLPYLSANLPADNRPSSSASSGSATSSSKRTLEQNGSSSSKRSKPTPAAKTTEKKAFKNGEGKPNLLSPSQKKANHIQSEQKRRANIRRGYEALCETVPALREAIREEEEANRLLDQEEESKGKGAKKSRSRGRAKGGADDADKIDGRAGPRSENVVLAKSIDYIVDLLAERASFMGRLQRGRSMLPPGHPLLASSGEQIWEREWKGGKGVCDEEEDDDESS